MKPAIIYLDEFENFHLKTQADCEEMCNIVMEKLETAGKKGHMRGAICTYHNLTFLRLFRKRP